MISRQRACGPSPEHRNAWIRSPGGHRSRHQTLPRRSSATDPADHLPPPAPPPERRHLTGLSALLATGLAGCGGGGGARSARPGQPPAGQVPGALPPATPLTATGRRAFCRRSSPPATPTSPPPLRTCWPCALAGRADERTPATSGWDWLVQRGYQQEACASAAATPTHDVEPAHRRAGLRAQAGNAGLVGNPGGVGQRHRRLPASFAHGGLLGLAGTSAPSAASAAAGITPQRPWGLPEHARQQKPNAAGRVADGLTRVR